MLPDTGGVPTACVGGWFLIYYGWTSLLFDFFPLGIIAYFHHNSFKHQKNCGSVLDTCQSDVDIPSPNAQNSFLNNYSHVGRASGQSGYGESLLMQTANMDVEHQASNPSNALNTESAESTHANPGLVDFGSMQSDHQIG